MATDSILAEIREMLKGMFVEDGLTRCEAEDYFSLCDASKEGTISYEEKLRLTELKKRIFSIPRV